MTRSTSSTTWLVGDIGGTNARFGLVAPDGTLLHSAVLADNDYPGIAEAIEAYLGQRGGLPRPRRGAIAIASAVAGDQIRMTNHPWSFSISALGKQVGLPGLRVINDFTAQALALPHLKHDERVTIGRGAPEAGAPIGVLGPGTGLGVSGMIPSGRHWMPLNGEGGHATMSPVTDRESDVLGALRRRLDHVSAERVLSGPGLVNLYSSLAEVDGVPAQQYTAAQISNAETCKTDALCREATDMFCAMLGTVAGNLALTLGARGGVYIGGGIIPRLGDRFAASPFRERFEMKGRLQDYLAGIPTYVVTHKLPAFLGCAAALMDR
ncbi:MAG: glucokinase [Alphaproteobacteria bacterium]|nr:glucokinase [Alphaproteobacteria bacterium]MBV9555328.1 glucokinase [Alphaproteobacteria bacterium]